MSYYRFLNTNQNLDKIIDSIKNFQIWHGNAFYFNDPTDGRPHISDSENALEILKTLPEEKVKRTLPEELRKQNLANVMDQWKRNTSLLSSVLADTNIQSYAISCFFRDDEFILDGEKGVNHFVSRNLAMWGHYAAGHSGICVEYDENILNKLLEMRKVEYTDVRPSVGCSELSSSKYLYLTKKAKYWKDESEYRSILEIGNDFAGLSKQLDQNPVRRVFLGNSFSNYKEIETKLQTMVNQGKVYITCPNRTGFFYTWQPLSIAKMFSKFNAGIL